MIAIIRQKKIIIILIAVVVLVTAGYLALRNRDRDYITAQNPFKQIQRDEKHAETPQTPLGSQEK